MPHVAAPLTSGSHPGSNAPGRRKEDDENLVAHALTSEGADASEDGTGRGTPLVAHTLNASHGTHLGQGHNTTYVAASMAVRRLSTLECSRLQGVPDDWLGEPNQQPDSPRYAALGDAVTVNVAEWIGQKIMEAM